MRARRHAYLLALAAALPAACSSGGETTSGSGGSTGGATSSSASSASSASSGIVTSTGTGGELPQTFTVSGVVTDGKDPVEGAIVMQGGAGSPAMTTGPDGAYSITLTQDIPGTPTVVAAKIGYRAAAEEFYDLPAGPVDLALRFVAPPDNEAYPYGDPGTGDPAHDNSTLFCGHCHTTFAKQFQSSAHAMSARDPLVQDLYAGVASAVADAASCQAAGGVFRAGLVPGAPATSAMKCYVGGGVLPDLNGCGAPGNAACDDPALPAAEKPASFGRCADCHAPGIPGKVGGRNLHDATGFAFDDGNHCDVCHHVADVDLSKPPGVGGALVMQRPRETISADPGAKILQAMFGPLPDVPNGFMGGSWQPKFATSELCGGCHEQRQEALVPGAVLDPTRWPDGLPTHSTHSEWVDGPYNTPGTPCQFCHMPADDTGLTNAVDVTTPSDASITFGFVRPPEQIRKHIFRHPLEGSPRLVDQAASVGLATSVNGGELTVDVQVKNKGAGHALPTGEPMRAMLLLVDAEACGQPMIPVGGMTLNDVGGAAAEGMVGADVTAVSDTLTWAAGAARAKPGDAVRVVRPTGAYDDYAGIGFFADPALSPMEKGLEIRTPVGEATVVSAANGALTLSSPLPVQPGDLVYLGDATATPADGAISLALAGRAGYSFARIMVDPDGARGVPHYRAIDIASDNRLAPGAAALTTHTFLIPPGCAAGQVTATLVYRPVPVHLARERGWDAKDYVIAEASKNVSMP